MAGETGLLGAPIDLAVDRLGRLYILDALNHRIVRLSVSGNDTAIIGRQGAGPGEFERPSAFAVDEDTVRVADAGNGRVVVLSDDGTYVRSYLLPAEAISSQPSLGVNGRLVVGTSGLDDVLARSYDAEGRRIASYGAPVTKPVSGWDFASLRKEAADGRVPAALRNLALPVLDDQGDVWLILTAEGRVERYDSAGTRMWTHELTGPELNTITQAFYDKNRAEQRPFAFHPLTYVADATVSEGSLWILLNTPAEQPSVIHVIAPDGKLNRRVVLDSVHGGQSLAVDMARRRVYIAVPGDASVLSLPLP